MTPKRIQRKRTKGWRMPEGAVNCTRPGKWGNPFKVGMTVPAFLGRERYTIETAQQAADEYRFRATHWEAGMVLRSNIRRDLTGKDLACWCALDAPCHVDTILEIANPGQ